MIELNPLNILGKREVKTMPPHFSKLRIEYREYLHEDDQIHNWVSSKLKGRFSIKKMPTIGNDGRMRSEFYIGFEDQKELTYFILACPYIRR